jgi:two-component system, cell cycle response regulator
MPAPKSKGQVGAPAGGMTLQIDRADLGRSATAKPQNHFLLVCVQGIEVGKPVELVLAETIVGRAPNCGLVIADSKVSRHHAKLLWMDGFHVLEDMNSANGTFVGGSRVTRQRLSPGNVIQFGSAFAFRYSVMDSTEMSLLEQLYQSSVLDALTGAHNREYFNSALGTELGQTQNIAAGLCLLMLDIDYFKKINDTYGHPAGDAVLIEIVNRIRLRLRPSDVLCRFGGEEFVIILRATTMPMAARLAERLRQAVRKQKFLFAQQSIPVTLSVGCASLEDCGDDRSPDALVAIADRRLYAAKRSGRDRVVVSD